jgi:hypothetical protein
MLSETAVKHINVLEINIFNHNFNVNCTHHDGFFMKIIGNNNGPYRGSKQVELKETITANIS